MNIEDILRQRTTLYMTGETVPISGIYEVVNDAQHTEKHQVTSVKGERFPPCSNCKYPVKFRLSIAARHLTDSPSFH